MESLRSTIHGYFDHGYTCVFPNEVSARFWISDYAMKSQRGAIRTDRALSWDAFRKLFLPVHEDLQPTTPLVQQLFAKSLVEQSFKGVGPRLRYFVPLDFPESSGQFCHSIAKMLVQLQSVDEVMMAKLPEDMCHDLIVLKTSYTQFLQDHNLYEPAYETPSVSYADEAIVTQKRFCIMFPKTIVDYPQFSKSLGEHDWLVSYDLDETSEDGVSLEVFDNQLQEIRTQLRRIGALLNAGIPTREILITCARLDDIRDIIEEEARLREIPIRVVQGNSPSSYPAGRFFKAIKRVYDEQASLDSMKELLLNPNIPWKDISKQRMLLACAVELNIERGDMKAFSAKDAWVSRLGRNYPELASWYRSFKQSVRDICTANTVQMLRMQINEFQDAFFTDEQWKGTSSAELDTEVYSFCLNQISEIDHGLQLCGYTRCEGLYDFFLTQLEHTRYVPRLAPQGIALYAWPLSACLRPQYHFVLNMSHDAVQSISTSADFIPEILEDAELRKEQDATADILALYRQCEANTYLSCSRRTYAKVALPPSWFVEHGKAVAPDRSVHEESDMFINELLLWSDKKPLAPCTHENQKQWFERAMTSTLLKKDRNRDMAYHKLADVSSLEHVYKQSLLPISPTSLDMFSNCPFSWACRYVFSMKDVAYEVSVVDHMSIGTFIHTVYQRFFEQVTKRYAVFDPEDLDMYRALLTTICEEEFEVYKHQVDAPSAPTCEWIRQTYFPLLPSILDEEANSFPNTRSWGFEFEIHEVNTDEGYSLNGKIDRVLLLDPTPEESLPSKDEKPIDLRGRSVAVIDYKKGLARTANSFANGIANGQIASSQLPIYRRLLRKEYDAATDCGCYFSVKGEKYVQIWPVSGKVEVDIVRLDELVDLAIEKMVKDVHDGNLLATPSEESCDGCIYRQVCRRRYVVQ